MAFLLRNYFLFSRPRQRGMWLDHAFQELFWICERLCAKNAGRVLGTPFPDKLRRPRGSCRARIYDQFKIDVLANQRFPAGFAGGPCGHRGSGLESQGSCRRFARIRLRWTRHLLEFAEQFCQLGELTRENTSSWNRLFERVAKTRVRFRELAHHNGPGHPTARTANLSRRTRRGIYSESVGRERRWVTTGIVPRTDADRNGADERRRRLGDADTPGSVRKSQPQNS